MNLSVLLSSLPLDFEPAVRAAAALGFRHVDPVALVERSASHREALADADVLVSCAPVGRGLAEGLLPDAPSPSDRRACLEMMKRQVADAAELGATHAYMIPGLDPSEDALARFGEAASLLADFAASRMVKLCVEHIPGRALPTATATLAWLERVGHKNLFLLLDVGHCLMSSEDAAAVIRAAGPRLGYVHFDDNDGIGDLHWPLLTGKLTEAALHETIAALRQVNYRGSLCLELNPGNDDPVGGLRRSKAILERCLGA